MEGNVTKEQFLVISKSIKNAASFLSKKEYSIINIALILLFREAEREITRLLSSLHDLTLVSLSVRNLFEIYLISRHISANEKALYNWHGQSHKDSKDVRDGFIGLMEKKALDASELREIQKFEEKNVAASPFTSKGPFILRDLADKYGYLDDYLFVYKLSSKLVHPSSMKVMAYETLSENANYLNIVLQVGVHFTYELNSFAVKVVEENA